MTQERLIAGLADRYRIERQLGQGGMATVYLAQDLKHDRKVALKVLRPELAAVLGAERFVQEIKTTAALQHPHILPLFDSGTAEGFLYYVMPYIQGETLRAKLDRERLLGVDEAVRITTEVADALDYAHRQGVIHRDIKPENILLHDGRPMVADFGIALAVSAAAGGRLTETGLSLGTPHYMSPEQATAEKDLTARSDIYSLGSVLYEMLTGNPPHVGASAQQIIMKIVTEEAAPVTSVRKAVPPNVAAAVAKSIEKLPADRFESAKVLAEALHNPRFGFEFANVQVAGAATSRSRRVAENLTWLGVGALAAVLAIRPWHPMATGGEARSQVTYSGRAVAPSISPDGRFVAYLERRCPEPTTVGGCMELQVLEVGTTRPVQVITGATRLDGHRWTHDGLNLVVGGEVAAGRSGLFVVPRLGGTPRRITDSPLAFDTHPSADSLALLVARDTGHMVRVVHLISGEGDSTVVAADFTPQDLAWSPDGRRFAVTSAEAVHVLGRDGRVRSSRFRTRTRAHLRWSADGRHILAFQWTASGEDDLAAFRVRGDGSLDPPRVVAPHLKTLYAGRFDVARASGQVIVGSGTELQDVWSFGVGAARVTSQRLTHGSTWYGPPVLTADGGALYYLRADPLGNGLYRNIDGRETALSAEPQVVMSALRLSPDDQAITFESRIDSTNVLMIHDIQSGGNRRVPREADARGWLLSGGKRILWFNPVARRLWITGSEEASAGDSTTVLDGSRRAGEDWFEANWVNWALAPDGRSVAIHGRSPDGGILFRVPLTGGEPAPLGRFSAADGNLGLAGWAGDGLIYLFRSGTGEEGEGTTSVVALDPATRSSRVVADLPAACSTGWASYAPAGHRAACTVFDRRADLLLIDGLRL